MYDNRAKRWACCGIDNGTKACEHPTKEMFDAPRPVCCSYENLNIEKLTSSKNDLQTYFVIGEPTQSRTDHRGGKESMPSTVIPTASSTASASSQSHSHSQSRPESKLSGAATGGIGAGVAIGALAIIGIILFVCLRRKSRRKEVKSTPFSSPQMDQASARAWVGSSHPGNDPAPPFYPSTTSSTPMTRAEPFHESSIAELGSSAKAGSGHPLSDNARHGLPMRHELPSDNEIRPLGIVSPLSPIHDTSPGPTPLTHRT